MRLIALLVLTWELAVSKEEIIKDEQINLDKWLFDADKTQDHQHKSHSLASLRPECYQPKETGTCRGYMLRYFYNKTTERCQRFVYGGCGGNKNNFESYKECTSYCHSETKCEKLRNEANNGMLGRHVPQCKADGSFEPRQCDGSTGYCACVDKNGSEVPGTQTPPGGREPNCRALAETKCEKLHEKAVEEIQKGTEGVYTPNCQADGRFDPLQCDGYTEYCWCVDDNGSEIPGTRKKFAENDQPECTEDLVGKGEEVATETIQV